MIIQVEIWPKTKQNKILKFLPTNRLAHPGGPLTTNKAAALAKFLERKLQDPNGLASIDPDLLEVAVKNAKSAVFASTSLILFCIF